MKFASLLQRARLQDSHAVSPAQTLRMATINGARALGLDHLVGSIEVGKRADLIVLDLLGAAHSVAVHNVVSQLVHCARPSNVELVMVDGLILMEDRTILDVDEAQLLHDAQAAGERLVARLG
jgi:5-methylthioadenosine/S-adenosylhomocysteine deaminase